jgi:hypothetical protein
VKEEEEEETRKEEAGWGEKLETLIFQILLNVVT